MGVIIPVGGAEVTQEFRLAGKPDPMVVVTGHDVLGPLSADQIATIVRDAWELAWGWPTGQPNAWTLGKATCRYRTAPDVLNIGEDTTVTTGTGAALDSMPINCALLIKKTTGFAGRKFRGRMYVPGFGVPDGAVGIDGTLTAPTRNGAQTAANNWLSTCSSFDVPLMLFHSDATPATTVVNLAVEPRIATQRRRLR